MVNRERNVARAREVDDVYADDRCPGCKQHIPQWWLYPAHMNPRSEPRVEVFMSVRALRRDATPWPFIARYGPHDVCAWTDDYLTARRFRREYIARHSEVNV